MKYSLALPIIGIGFALHYASAIGVDEQPHQQQYPQPQQHHASSSSLRRSGSGRRASRARANDGVTCGVTKDGKTGKIRSRDLEEFPQWREEVGYWIGDLSFYEADGTPYERSSWNYPYDNYRGFITGNIAGGSYRQRNVFLYPPQTAEACANLNSTTGDGICGVNGNTRLFEADQSTNGSSCDGTIEGTFPAGFGTEFDTKTTLVGEDNALLYQVFYQGNLFQSQLTTLSGNGRRTRSAHGFNSFDPTNGKSIPTYCSFYRERRVDRDEFYATLNETRIEYGILDADFCTRNNLGVLLDGVVGGFDACTDHLDESLGLGDFGVFD
mmetsp:Transcript_38541/g.80769  ORF Transcript_38541/g.80769 Transcript_38541/m.80769 type:complete len:326 (+) Transcript_38541:135-1112(+)